MLTPQQHWSDKDCRCCKVCRSCLLHARRGLEVPPACVLWVHTQKHGAVDCDSAPGYREPCSRGTSVSHPSSSSSTDASRASGLDQPSSVALHSASGRWRRYSDSLRDRKEGKSMGRRVRGKGEKEEGGTVSCCSYVRMRPAEHAPQRTSCPATRPGTDSSCSWSILQARTSRPRRLPPLRRRLYATNNAKDSAYCVNWTVRCGKYDVESKKAGV